MRVAARLSSVVVLSLAVLAVAAVPAAHAAGVVRVESESYTAQVGTRLSPAPYPAGGVVVDVSHGDWLRYDGVTADRAAFTLFCVVTAAPSGTPLGSLEIRLGSPWSAPVMTVPVQANLGRGIKEWAGAGAFPDGVHTVWIRVRQPRGAAPFSLDYVLLSEFPPPPSLNCA
ncbi:MAG TPA: carbohydrate-binding protein [Micromonosporaceae bacterium]|nr:carbohydrate-binding protein [Micromonosporaceae bacterium]